MNVYLLLAFMLMFGLSCGEENIKLKKWLKHCKNIPAGGYDPICCLFVGYGCPTSNEKQKSPLDSSTEAEDDRKTSSNAEANRKHWKPTKGSSIFNTQRRPLKTSRNHDQLPEEILGARLDGLQRLKQRTNQHVFGEAPRNYQRHQRQYHRDLRYPSYYDYLPEENEFGPHRADQYKRETYNSYPDNNQYQSYHAPADNEYVPSEIQSSAVPEQAQNAIDTRQEYSNVEETPVQTQDNLGEYPMPRAQDGNQIRSHSSQSQSSYSYPPFENNPPNMDPYQFYNNV